MQYKFKDTPHKAQNAFDEGLYSFRKSPNVLDGAYDRLLLNKVVGGTLAVNQFNSNNKETGTVSDVTFTNNGDGSWTLNGTASASGAKMLFDGEPQKIINHVYFVRGFVSGGSGSYLGQGGISIDTGNGGLWKNTQYTTNFNLRIDFAAGNSWNNAKIYPQVTDLTQFFCGSTIADYVYNLEQSTAGSGVAWLKQYYPSIFNGYQPYNAGELMSVEASAHVMRGFNQFNLEDFATTYPSYCSMVDDDEMSVTTYSSLYYNGISVNFKPIHMTYEVKCGTATGVRIKCVFEDGYSASFSSSSSTTYVKRDLDFSEAFTNLHGNLVSVRLDWSGTGTFWIKNACANVSAPEKSGTYERYVENVYPLDSDLVLRGIPKLNNGVPYYDGDEYKSDGSVNRRYGVVDMGDLSWTYFQNGIFYANYSAKAYGLVNMICSKYETNASVSVDDKRIYGRADSSRFYVQDKAYSDAATFKTAVTGQTICFELATPTTETADPYTNPQVCYSDGTEEFTDFAVASGSRDISLPVQCESMYYESVPLPAEALSINGKFIEDVIDGYRTLNVTGRETMAQEIKEAEVGKHDGAFFQFRRYPTRDIVVKYQIIAESNEAYRNAFIRLNQMLDFSEGVLVFNDETDKYFVGTPTDVELPEPGLNCAVGEFTLHCEDPFKYSVQEKGVAMQSDANGYFFGLDYKGTHKSYPRIETDFYNTDTEDDSNGECSFISFMKTDGKILLFGDPENTDANRAPVRIFQRASSAPAVPSSQVTFSFESQTVTNPSALGSWSTTIPSGESTLWTTMAIAESTATNAYINQTDWGTVEQYANQDDSALYSINSKTEVNKKFTSQGTAWASNSGKIYNDWLETGTPGIVTPQGGNKYITASGYGSGSDWHGPSVTRTKSDDMRDFLFTFNYAFYQGTGDQASKQTGLLQAVLWNSTQSKIIAALSFWKNSGNSKGSIRMVVGGKSVKTLSEVPFGKETQTVTTDANACSIKKIGSTVIFNVKGTEYRFVDESIKETATDKVTFYFAKKGTTTAMDEIGVHSAQLIKYYQPVSPNPFTSNDELRINTKNTAVQLNGLDAQGLGALANDWEGFYLKPGINLIGVVWSEYVPSTYKPTCRLYYREVYL